MTTKVLTRKERFHRRGVRLEVFTITWNVVEAVVAIGAGILAGRASPTSSARLYPPCKATWRDSLRVS